MSTTDQLLLWLRTSRARLTLLFGGISLLMALIVAIYIDHERTEELARVNSDLLLLTGKPIAMALAEGLKEREREIVLLSHHPMLAQGPLDSAVIEGHFEEIQQSFPAYSWIGLADEKGQVQSSTGGVLKHQSVLQRPWFSAGLNGPYSGDAHEALLLDKHLRTDPAAEPLRFLDFSSPVRRDDGVVRGVLGAHLNWEWATGLIANALKVLPRTDDLEILIVNRQGEFLHPRNIRDDQKPSSLPGIGSFANVQWGKDGEFLTTTLELPATTIQSLGWTLVVRQPMAAALAPIKQLHIVVARWSIGLTVILMLMIYWVARRFSLPVEQLADEARSLDETGQGADFSIKASTVEFAHLSDALRKMTQHLLQSKNELLEANLVLEQKVRDRTAEIALRELQYKGILEDQTEIICRFNVDHTLTYVNDAYCRMFGLKREDVLGRIWAPVVHPDDLDRVKQELTAISVVNPVLQIENRVIAGTGEVRWCQFVNRAYFDSEGVLREWQTVGRDITSNKLLELELQRVSSEYQDLYNHAPCGYYSVDADGVIVRINDLALKWMGVERVAVLGKARLVDYLDQAGQAAYWEHFPTFLERGQTDPVEFNLMGRNGITRRVSLAATAIRDSDGRFVMSRSVMYDVSELFIMRYQLRQLNAEQEAMLDNDLLGIARLKDRKIVWRNKALERIFGYEPGELLGVDTSCMYPSDEAYNEFGIEAYPVLKAGQHFRKQTSMRKKNGDAIWLDISGVRLSEETGESLWLLQDISEMKQYQAQVEHIAFHDTLTGLPNRLLFSDHLRLSMALNDRMGTLTALCYLDLDGFKPINDRFGHEAGDEVLKEVATRLSTAVRANDTAARMGGDEFALLLTNLTRAEEAELVIRRVLFAIKQPITLKSGPTVSVSSSVGVAFYPTDATQPAALFAKADSAMYRNKKESAGERDIAH
ncbi:MAG: diguanylate cyclase [Curvibacter sp.]|nr:MAG: diguanylate cyclase [Curvibacter sp.]